MTTAPVDLPRQRTIFILLDGTWNDADAPGPTTSVVRLRETLRQWVLSRSEDTSSDVLIYYDRGVGTSFFQRVSGGAIGIGLDEGIRRAYRYLCDVYRPGDRLIIGGFSRGAYTARSLVGLLSSIGLLKREHCVPNIEASIWDFYRARRGNRGSGTAVLLQPYLRPLKEVNVDCLAVFDTVGALGIPVRALWRFNRDLYEFHDVSLSASANLNLHALAIDEHRLAFEASLWRGLSRPSVAANVEQVWFPGSHGDIGGGYIDSTEQCLRIDDLPYSWLLTRLNFHFPDLKLPTGIDVERLTATAIDAVAHRSRRGIYRLFPKAIRAIGREAKISVGFRQTIVCRDRYQPVLGEAVHISSLERLGRVSPEGRKRRHYLPANLIAALPELATTYGDGLPTVTGNLLIIGWDGKILNPLVPESASAARQIIKQANERVAGMRRIHHPILLFRKTL